MKIRAGVFLPPIHINKRKTVMNWISKAKEILKKTLEMHKGDLKVYFFLPDGTAKIVAVHHFPSLPVSEMDVKAKVEIGDIADLLESLSELNDHTLKDIDYMDACWGFIESALWTYHEALKECCEMAFAAVAFEMGEESIDNY